MSMDALEAIRTRRSVRTFENRSVPRETIEAVIDCGRLAASALNMQPWEFVVITDTSMRARIAETTEHGHHISEAPVCVLVFCRDCTYYLEDGAAAAQNILVAARALGLGTCWVAGDKKAYAERVAALVGAPEDCKLVTLIALGFAAEAEAPEKRTLEDVLHWECF